MPVPFDIGELALREENEINALLAAHQDIAPERFADEELLICGGADTNDIFLLVQGGCIVESVGAPKERRAGDALAILQATPDSPVFVGEMAYLGHCPRSAGVRSVMSTCALRLRPFHLDAIMEGFPGLTRILCKQFSLRLREANDQLHTLRGKMALHPEQIILESGQSICESGVLADTLYQLVDGTLISENDETRIRPEPGKPCFIEAQPFFTQGRYSNSYAAKGMAIVLAHSAETRTAIVRNYPELVLALLDT